MAKRSAPEVNAGSMADIAFLLLIFFLVTTTIETDKGINRKLPPIQDENTPPPPRKEKNVFKVLINDAGELFVEDDRMKLKDLRQAAVDFVDNGGGTGSQGCEYCQGKHDALSSDNPEKAIITLQNNRQTKYGVYIAVQNELVGAYIQLRNRAAKNLFGKTYTQMESDYNDGTYTGDKEKLKKQIDKVRDMYPENLSEAKPKESE